MADPVAHHRWTVAAVLVCAAAAVAAPVKFDNSKVRVAETSFGDLLADAIAKAAGTDIAIVNAGAMKGGPVEAESGDELAGLLANPGEKIAVLSLSGEQLTKALELGLSTLPRPSSGFLQVSGLKVTYDPSAGSGKRVKTTVLAKTGKPLAPGATYRVATSLSLGRGGQGYFTVFGRDAIKDTKETVLREVLEEYAVDAAKLSAVKTGRLQSVGK